MYSRPPEWRKPKTICLAWPFDKNLWAENLAPAQQEFLALVNALIGESLLILVPHQQALNHLQSLLISSDISFKIISYGDIWLRDTMPIWLLNQAAQVRLLCPHFNGWGGKYLFKDDHDLRIRMAREFGLEVIESSLVLEGGAIECNGQGTVITTEQCLLNPNRHPDLGKDQIEAELKAKLGAHTVIWLNRGLLNDHTDGHVDTIARFIGPNTVALMMARETSDPNAQLLLEIKQQLGMSFNLLELPSPGKIIDEHGEIMPASYLNFIIGDQVVIMPTYHSHYDQEALAVLRGYFEVPVIACSARAILSGGGAFHCMSQEIFRF